MRLYFFIAAGLAVIVPVSVLSTFGTLSYLILKQEDVTFVTGPPGETGMPEETDDPAPADTSQEEPDKTEEKEEKDSEKEEPSKSEPEETDPDESR